MAYRSALVGVMLAILLGSCTTSERPNQTYRHPILGMSFTAAPGWTQGQWPSDTGVYEAVDPQSTVHVVLWHTETEQDAFGYLLKMADMKGLNLEREAEKTAIGRSEAWLLDTMGMHDGKPIHTLLAVIPHGKVESRPRESVLLIAQIWCPEGSSATDVASMRAILSTLRIED